MVSLGKSHLLFKHWESIIKDLDTRDLKAFIYPQKKKNPLDLTKFIVFQMVLSKVFISRACCFDI